LLIFCRKQEEIVKLSWIMTQNTTEDMRAVINYAGLLQRQKLCVPCNKTNLPFKTSLNMIFKEFV
jgi:hypothetical protein